MPIVTAPPSDDVFELWRKIAAFPVAEIDSALLHLQQWIARSIDADNVIWVASVRVLRGAAAQGDSLLGWRGRIRRTLRPDTPAHQQLLAAYFEQSHSGKLTPSFYQRSHQRMQEAHIGAAIHALTATAGRFRAHRLRDGWIDYNAFRRSLHFQLYYRNLDVVDRIWVIVPVTARTESVFVIDRLRSADAPRRRAFSERDLTLVSIALRGLPEFHRRLFLGAGLLAGDKPFSPREAQLLRALLTSQSEKEMAAAAGLKISTLHQYVKALYRRLGVNSRQALMALWLAGAKISLPARPPPV